MQKKVVFCNKYGEKLSGILHIPKALHEGPVVIISSGLIGSKAGKKAMCEELARRGIISLRFDFSGFGESQGDHAKASVQKRLEDLDAAVSFARSLEHASRVYLCGYSDGGMVSAIYAAEHAEIAGVATISAVFDYKDPALLLNSIKVARSWLKKVRNKGLISHFKSAAGFRMWEIVPRIKCPFLIIHGSKDELVPIGHALRYQESATSKRLLILHDAPHLFPKRYQMQSAGHIAKWIKRLNESTLEKARA